MKYPLKRTFLDGIPFGIYHFKIEIHLAESQLCKFRQENMNDDILTKIKTQNETFRNRIDKKIDLIKI